MVYALGCGSRGLCWLGLLLHLVETVKERLVTSSRNKITAITMTSTGYRLRGGVRSVWLEHSSLPVSTVC